MARNFNNEQLWLYTKIGLSLAMGLAYVAIGILVMIKQWFMVVLDSNISYILGSLLVIYGLYRSYRVIRSFF